jgi:hypothetical protein
MLDEDIVVNLHDNNALITVHINKPIEETNLNLMKPCRASMNYLDKVFEYIILTIAPPLKHTVYYIADIKIPQKLYSINIV